MTDAIECPHCLLHVLPTNGICPSCAKDVNDADLAIQSRHQRDLADLIETLKQKRATDTAVTEAAVQAGFTSDLSSQLLANRRKTVIAARFEIKKKYLWPGYPAFIFGTGVTVGTLTDALHGGEYIAVLYGMIFYGLCSILVGHMKLRSYPL